MTTPAFEDRPPVTDRVNAYDERHLVTYIRLLDADEEGADWREVVCPSSNDLRQFEF